MGSLPQGLKEKPKFRNGDTIHFLGQAVSVSIILTDEDRDEQAGRREGKRPRSQNTCKVELKTEANGNADEKILIIHWPNTLGKPKPQMIHELLKEWYKQNAKAIIKERVQMWSHTMKLSYNRITIKDQRTRWGSCSTLRNLNFNWRLVMAPLAVLDYVVVHELAHLVEMNHSARFWSIVESYFPDFKECKDWLKHNGMTLFYIP
jgi:predicted metal-dependent hydrolase